MRSFRQSALAVIVGPWRHKPVLALLAGTVLGTVGQPASDDGQPRAREVLQAVGVRLSRSWSEGDLTAIATRADLLIPLLTPRERTGLGSGYLRFRVDSPAVIDVAVPPGSVPFWLADQGFSPTSLLLENAVGQWRLYRRTFEGGWIGLGVNGLDRGPQGHYAVFVRGLARAGEGARLPGVTLEPARERGSCWKTIVATPGVSPAHDWHSPFKSLPAELAGAVLLQSAHGQRHSTLLATGRVWKTHVVSTARPDQVTVSFGEDAARELVWTWRTTPSVCATALRLARSVTPSPRSRGHVESNEIEPGAIRVIRGESVCVEVRNLLNDPVIRRHRVRVTDLEPDTVYRYSLGDGSPDGWGPWRTVKTGPERGRGVQILYLGDAQTGLERWGHLLEAAYQRHPRADCLLLAGDLVDRGNERTNWDHFFLRAAGVFDRVPLMPCVGNHEYLDMGPRLYRAFFELPANGPAGIDPGLVYHFECGDVCCAVLDSTLAVWNSGQARRQAAWLDAVLAQTTATWKLVMFHHPVYPSHPWRDMPGLREYWVPVFDRHHVDLVLQGHDHAYQRTYPLRAHRRAASPADGTIYVIAVSGDKFVELTARDYVLVGRAQVASYQTIETDPRAGRLRYRAWTVDGSLFDEFTLEKPARPLFVTGEGARSAIESTTQRAALLPATP